MSAPLSTKKIERVLLVDATGVAVAGDLSSESTLQSLYDLIAGAIETTAADDEPIAGDPDRIAGSSVSSITTSRVSQAGDTAHLITDLDRTLLVRLYGTVADKISGTLTNTDGARTQVIAAQAANIASCLTHISLYNTSAAGVVVNIDDGTTTKMAHYLPATSGCIMTLICPLVGTAATAWNIDAASATTSVICNMIGYIAKVS